MWFLILKRINNESDFLDLNLKINIPLKIWLGEFSQEGKEEQETCVV
jgi:hypothetical protein